MRLFRMHNEYSEESGGKRMPLKNPHPINPHRGGGHGIWTAPIRTEWQPITVVLRCPRIRKLAGGQGSPC